MMKLACRFNRTLDHSLLLGNQPDSDELAKAIAAAVANGPKRFDPSAMLKKPILHPGHITVIKGVEGKQVLLEERSPIGNQGRLGSCTANRRADGLELVQPKANVTQISRLGIYWPSRAQHGDECNDSGSYSHVSAAIVENVGVCREDLWPYDDTPPTGEPGGSPDAPMLLRPPLLAYEDMYDHRLPAGAIQRIRGSGKGRVYQVLAALDCGFPVGIDASVDQAFCDGPDPNTAVVSPTRPIGGHAILLVGYLERSDGTYWFRLRNSWGRGWGENGYCWIADSYLADAMAVDDVDVTTMSPIWSKAA